ncbi:spirocyclase AveC family protein [Mycolicibacterium sp. XJ1819]
MDLLAQDLIPPGTAEPSGVWFFNWVIPIVGSIFIVLAIADVIRRRRLTWGFLFLFNSMAVYWMETVGDWGQMLFYSPAFTEHHLLDWLPLKTPNDPLFMPFAYAVYWGVHALLVLWLSQWLSSRMGWSMLKSMVVLAIPVNYVWDFIVEGLATAMGWWTYNPGIGPVLEWGNGGRITLLWTIGLMCTWPNLIAYWAGKPPVRGLNHLERFAGLDRFTRPKTPAKQPVTTDGSVMTLAAKPARLTKTQEYDDFLNYEVTIPRWRFELMRLGAWFVGFQVSFFLFLVLPLVALRTVLGVDSPYVP